MKVSSMTSLGWVEFYYKASTSSVCYVATCLLHTVVHSWRSVLDQNEVVAPSNYVVNVSLDF